MIELENIVWGLSYINRFLGHTKQPISVLRHSIHVFDLAPDHCKAEALFHDGSESMSGDVVTAIKCRLPAFKVLEVKIEKLIARKFDLVYPWPADVKKADIVSLADEMKLYTDRLDYKDLAYPPSGLKMPLWSPEKTRREFMARYNSL